MLFIIGNGFDLAMGLRTSYNDFVKWYLEQQEKDTTDERINKFKKDIQKDLNSNKNSWADFEIKLGEYTQKYTEDEINDFIFLYRHLKENLNEYLKKQENIIEMTKYETTKEDLSDFILGFYNRFPVNIKNIFSSIFENYNGSIKYNFINFNYTQTLERCLDEYPNAIRTRKNTYKDVIGDILHIHGKIDNAPLFGVDSEHQIKNEILRKDLRIIRALVKPRLNEDMQENTAHIAQSLINSNNIICIFGTSIGDSDISWWEKIGKWLKSSDNKKLVIFWYSEESISPLHYDHRLTEEDNIRKCFVKQAGFTEKEYDQIANKIYIHIHTNIFTTKLIEKND